MILFCQDKTLTSSAGTVFTLRLRVKSVFIPARRDRFPLGICLQKPIPIDLKMFTFFLTY